MSSSHLPTNERVVLGKQKEDLIFDLLDARTPGAWRKASDEEDKNLKIDAWYTAGDTRLSVQIKYREEGQDLGIAVLQPWLGLKEFQNDWENTLPKWDRDAIKRCDLYVCYANGQVIIASGHIIKEIYDKALWDLAEDFRGFGKYGKTFIPTMPGVELKLKTDDYSGSKKVICYIQPKVLIERGAYSFKAEL